MKINVVSNYTHVDKVLAITEYILKIKNMCHKTRCINVFNEIKKKVLLGRREFFSDRLP